MNSKEEGSHPRIFGKNFRRQHFSSCRVFWSASADPFPAPYGFESRPGHAEGERVARGLPSGRPDDVSGILVTELLLQDPLVALRDLAPVRIGDLHDRGQVNTVPKSLRE